MRLLAELWRDTRKLHNVIAKLKEFALYYRVCGLELNFPIPNIPECGQLRLIRNTIQQSEVQEIEMLVHLLSLLNQKVVVKCWKHALCLRRIQIEPGCCIIDCFF